MWRQAPLGQVIQYGGAQQAAAADDRVGLLGQRGPLVAARRQPHGAARHPRQVAQQRQRRHRN